MLRKLLSQRGWQIEDLNFMRTTKYFEVFSVLLSSDSETDYGLQAIQSHGLDWDV